MINGTGNDERPTEKCVAGGSLALTGAQLRGMSRAEDSRLASGILIEGGQIVFIGTDAEVAERAQAVGIEVRHLAGATVTPGLFDSHTHPHWAADITAGVDLAGCATIEDIRAVLAAEHARLPEGAWLRGWNLEYEPFETTGLRGDLLADAAPGRPVALICYDLHTALATAPALDAAGITAAREFGDASEIVVDDSGAPTGELREPTAYNLLFDAAPAASHEAERDALRDMLRKLAATGLTGGAIMDGKPATAALLAELEERGELDQRLTVHHWHAVGDTDDAVARVIADKDAGGRLWHGGAIKLFSDGVIDTGTAWLHETDACGDGRAAFWSSWERFAEVVRAYHDAGMLIATHAVGDYAVQRVLEVYAALPPRPGLPVHSIEHLEVLSDADVERLRAFGTASSGDREISHDGVDVGSGVGVEVGVEVSADGGSNATAPAAEASTVAQGVTASMQPLHMQWREGDFSDNWAQRLGEHRAATGYRVRDVIDAGVTVTLGSDWPVAQYDPRIGMAWARGRHTPGDASAHVFEPSQQLTGEEALLAYTLWPARARGHADRGVLAVGAVADLTVWGADPVEATPDELPEVPILLTVVDGRIVHEL